MNLFNNNSPDEEILVKPTNKRKHVYYDYEGFVNKFKPKFTTDDCYTPPAIYDAVLSYVKSKINIDNLEIIRPFYPGGDYENFDYPDNSIVIDNPPFSIISKICKYYEEHNIKYFLFAPHLTLFSIKKAKNYIVLGVRMVYENGAQVNTSFVSNVFGGLKIITAPELYDNIKKCNADKVKLPKYVYPDNVLTVTMLEKFVKRNISIEIEEDALHRISKLQSQVKSGKQIFGYAFLTNDSVKLRIKAAEIKAAEIKDGSIQWALSNEEREIIDSLNSKKKTANSDK